MYWFLIPLSISLLVAIVWFIVSSKRRDDLAVASTLAKLGLGLSVAAGLLALVGLVVPADTWKPLFVIASTSAGLLACGFAAARAVVQVHDDKITRASGWWICVLFLASAGAFAWSAWLALAPYQG